MTRRLSAFIISLAVVTYIAQFIPRSQSHSASTRITAPDAIAFRIVFGAADKEPVKWDGSLQLSGGQIARLEPWRFSAAGDQIAANGSWKLSTERSARGTEPALGPIAEKGIVIPVVPASE